MVDVKVSVTGGSKLRRHLQQMREKLAEAQSVEIGFFPEDIHPKENRPLAAVAFDNEVGVPEQNIPARPFFSSTIETHIGEIGDVLTSSLKAVNYHMKPALEGLGNLVRMQVKNSIESWSTPMNARFTIAMKGFNDPLMETGFMADHVRSKVDGGTE